MPTRDPSLSDASRPLSGVPAREAGHDGQEPDRGGSRGAQAVTRNLIRARAHVPGRRLCGRPEEEGCAGLRDGLEAERESFGARRGDYPDGNCRSEDHPVVLARHSLQQARPLPVERPAREGRRLDRGPRRGHRPARLPAPEPQRPAGSRRRGRRDRHVRGPGRRPALPGAAAPGQAEAPRQDRAGPLRGARSLRPKSSPRTTRSPRTSSARRCIRSISSAPSRRCARRACPTKTSPPPSSSA